jgi:hypothetical protein
MRINSFEKQLPASARWLENPDALFRKPRRFISQPECPGHRTLQMLCLQRFYDFAQCFNVHTLYSGIHYGH